MPTVSDIIYSSDLRKSYKFFIMWSCEDRPLVEFPEETDGSEGLRHKKSFVSKLVSLWYCCCYGGDEEKSTASCRSPTMSKWAESVADGAASCCGRAQRWRSFVRRMKGNNSGRAALMATKSARFQYDPLSYSLNFDDGSRQEEEYGYRGFSARFAAPIVKPREMDNGI